MPAMERNSLGPLLADCTHSTYCQEAVLRQEREQSDSRSTTKESVMESHQHRKPWNKGKLIGQKPPLKPKDIWAIRIQLQNAQQNRDLAMFNLAIDSKLRGCDLVNLRVRDITHGNQILARAMVVQQKTQRPTQF